jgi:hypothetical protein
MEVKYLYFTHLARSLNRFLSRLVLFISNLKPDYNVVITRLQCGLWRVMGDKTNKLTNSCTIQNRPLLINRIGGNVANNWHGYPQILWKTGLR